MPTGEVVVTAGTNVKQADAREIGAGIAGMTSV